MSDIRIEIAKDFSPYPGGRYRADGSFSGEEFREKLLWPALQNARQATAKITVVLDGAAGYPASFLEEAFGGLVRVHGIPADELLQVLRVEAADPHFETYQRMVEQYIRDAAERRATAH